MEYILRSYYSRDEKKLRKGCQPNGLAIEVHLKSHSAMVAEVMATLRRTDIGHFSVEEKFPNG